MTALPSTRSAGTVWATGSVFSADKYERGELHLSAARDHTRTIDLRALGLVRRIGRSLQLPYYFPNVRSRHFAQCRNRFRRRAVRWR